MERRRTASGRRVRVKLNAAMLTLATATHHELVIKKSRFIACVQPVGNRREAQAIVAQGHVQLQETIVDTLAERLLAHPAVRAVRVATSKPDVYPDTEAVGVEVFRLKPAAPSN